MPAKDGQYSTQTARNISNLASSLVSVGSVITTPLTKHSSWARVPDASMHATLQTCIEGFH